jgi:glycosyltransferase involved in cell wall biosynthesis
MPLRNNAAYAVHAVDAILAQTWGDDLELIVVDDASDDPGARYVRRFADDRVRLFTFSFPIGQAHARNIGLCAARGAFFAVADADDVWLPGKLTRQLERLEREPALTVCGTLAYKMEADRLTLPLYPEVDDQIKAHLLYVDRALIHPSIVVRRDFVARKYVFYPPTRTTDVDYAFYLHCLENGARFANIQEPLVAFRRHEQNTTRDTKLHDAKVGLRAAVIARYFPELTATEAQALARIIDPRGKLPLDAVWRGLAAAEKAVTEQRSFYGECKPRAHRIINKYAGQIDRHLRRKLKDGKGPTSPGTGP